MRVCHGQFRMIPARHITATSPDMVARSAYRFPMPGLSSILLMMVLTVVAAGKSAYAVSAHDMAMMDAG